MKVRAAKTLQKNHFLDLHDFHFSLCNRKLKYEGCTNVLSCARLGISYQMMVEGCTKCTFLYNLQFH